MNSLGTWILASAFPEIQFHDRGDRHCPFPLRGDLIVQTNSDGLHEAAHRLSHRIKIVLAESWNL
jgi:hypothetical protein